MSETLPIVTDVAVASNAAPLEKAAGYSASEKRIPAPKAETAQIYPFHAYHLAEALKLKEVAKLFDLKPLVLNPTKLVYELSPNCFCFFYNFGSVVFFNVDEAIQKSTLERAKNFSFNAQGPQTTDEFLMEVERKAKNTVTFDKVIVDKLNRDKIEIAGLVLAQSTALEFFEKKVGDILDRLGHITFKLGERKAQDPSAKEIREFIGAAMATKQNLIGTLYLLEKPEETWESKVLDDLHQEATLMFELKDRFRALDYKLQTIQENLTLLANFATNRQMLILEVSIVVLFVLDILLVGYELFLK